MTDAAMPNQSGRVGLRDVLEAVNASEARITHRIDRLDEELQGHRQDTQRRLTVLETAEAIESARWRSMERFIGGTKGVILLLVAVVGMVVGVAGFMAGAAVAPIDVTFERAPVTAPAEGGTYDSNG